MLLVIDNYDSFTWNLVQMLGAFGADPVVVRNDERRVGDLLALGADRVVVSPGPCTPGEAGISVEFIRCLGSQVPVLGVCLGHQAIGEAFGGRTIRAAAVMHGKTAEIQHTGEGIFRGLSDPLVVTRYHSLVTDPAALPQELEVVAWSMPETNSPPQLPRDGEAAPEIQGVRHRARPIWGVQFHPESLFSEQGEELLQNFLRL